LEPRDVTSKFFTSGKALQNAAFVAESDKLKAEDAVEYVVLSTDENSEDSKSDSDEDVVSVSEGSESTEDEALNDDSEYLEEDYYEEILDDSNVNDYEEEVSYDEGNLPYVEITPEKLNLEYVSQLIEEIEELEKNPELYDAGRILYLHTELDAILEELEQ
jgi:hypothetical protein